MKQEIENDESDELVTYEILPQGTTRKNPLLVSSNGYTYTIRVGKEDLEISKRIPFFSMYC